MYTYVTQITREPITFKRSNGNSIGYIQAVHNKGIAIGSNEGKGIHLLGGNVGIGTTEPEGPLHVKTPHQRNTFSDGIGFLKGKGGNDYQLQINAVGGVPHIDLANSANEDYDIRLAVYHNNQLHIQGGNVDVSGKLQAKELVQKSDQRHKQNIQTLGGALAKIAQVRGVRFNWKDAPKNEQIGLNDC